jgi:hypothetical protein
MSSHVDHRSFRDSYVIVEALAFAIEAFQRLPDEHRPDSNITDMKRLVDDLVRQDRTLQHAQALARRRLEIIVAGQA